MRGKIIDGVLTYAPKNAIYENTKYIPAPDEILAKLGWKNIVNVPMPMDVPNYKHYESSYVDGDEIVQTWTLVDDTNEQICATLRQWFDVKYRMWNEMLTRFAAIGVVKEITDDLRGKSYHNLSELYSEAEAVRAEIEALEK